jgi:hypothetical protein
VRGGKFLGVLAGVGATVLAVGCGTQHAQAGNQPVDLPVMPQGPGNDAQWLVTTEVSGRWYVDIVRSTALFFGGPCS